MIPHIQSLDDFFRIRRQPKPWRDAVTFALNKAGIHQDAASLALQPHTTFPVFACQRYVVKIIGFLPNARDVFDTERAALTSLSDRSFAPNVLACVVLPQSNNQFWACLVMRRLIGSPLDPKAGARLLPPDLPELLCGVIRDIRNAKPTGLASLPMLSADQLVQAAAQTRIGVLNQISVEQLLLEATSTQRPVLCNSDIWQPHILMQNGTLTGIVDWGDAVLADPYFEYVQIFLNLFALNKPLMRRVLNGLDDLQGWCPMRMMVLALTRQSQMYSQHGAGDVFYQVPQHMIAASKRSATDLAEAMFSLQS